MHEIVSKWTNADTAIDVDHWVIALFLLTQLLSFSLSEAIVPYIFHFIQCPLHQEVHVLPCYIKTFVSPLLLQVSHNCNCYCTLLAILSTQYTDKKKIRTTFLLQSPLVKDTVPWRELKSSQTSGLTLSVSQCEINCVYICLCVCVCVCSL